MRKKASNYLIFAEIDELGLIFTDPYLSQLILKAISKRKLFFSFCGGWSDVFWVNYITAQKLWYSLVTPSEWYRSICVAMQLFFYPGCHFHENDCWHGIFSVSEQYINFMASIMRRAKIWTSETIIDSATITISQSETTPLVWIEVGTNWILCWHN